MLPGGVGVCSRVPSPVEVRFFLSIFDNELNIEVPFGFSVIFHEIDTSIPSSLC